MAKNLVLVLFIVTILAICGAIGYMYVSSKTQKAANEKKAFTLYKETGSVLYKTEQNYLEMSTDEVKLPSGTFVKTFDGEAHILFPDNSIMSIDDNTETQIFVNSTGISIDQLIGNTWHRVQNLIQGKSYEVQTPTAIASVRGTVFAVQIADLETSEAYVTDGKINLEQYTLEKDSEGAKKANRVIRDSTTLEAGKAGIVKKQARRIVAQTIREEVKKTKFYVKNAAIRKGIKPQELRSLIQERRQSIINKVEEVRQSTGTPVLDALRNNSDIIPPLEKLGDLLNIKEVNAQICMEFRAVNLFDGIKRIEENKAIVKSFGFDPDSLIEQAKRLYSMCESLKTQSLQDYNIKLDETNIKQ